MALPSTIQAILTRFRGTNNNAYNATSNPLGMGQGGQRQNFGPRLKDTADVLDWMSGAIDAVDADAQATAADRVQTGQDREAAAASAGAAAQSATDAAVQAARLIGTSNTSQTPSIASKTFTTQAGKAFDVGTALLIQSRSNIDRFMSGRVTAYSGTNLTVSVEGIGSVTSTAADWDIRVSGTRGLQGLQGIPGIATMPYVARTSNTQIVAANSATIFDLTGAFTQTFAACAVLGANWYAVFRNAGTGDITLDPNGSETIDGLTSFIMYPSEVRLIQCDGIALRSLVLAPAVKEFLSSANFVMPPGYSAVAVDVIGAGGGGAFGSNSFTRGAQGGAGGARDERTLPAPSAGTNVSVGIGAGGNGGASGVPPQKGGTSNFGDYSFAQGGNGGASQSTGWGSPSVLGPSALSAGAATSLPRENPSFGAGGGPGGGNGAQASGSTGNSSLRAGGGGGGGGASDGNGNNNGTGGRGGDSGTFDGSFGLGGSGGSFVSSGPAGNGSTGTAGVNGRAGSGGGGGGYSTNGTGGLGGSGGFPGGGGGGGGNGTTPGNGGPGAAGRVTVRMF